MICLRNLWFTALVIKVADLNATLFIAGIGLVVVGSMSTASMIFYLICKTL